MELTPESTLAPQPLTITELTARIRGTLEPAFGRVLIKGEISNYRPPSSSAHVYFSLKDEGASISAAIFGFTQMRAKGRIQFNLRDGLQVLCRGRISVYPPRGTYQLVVDQIDPLGAGALQAQFEELKLKLLQEGLFESSRKRSLPRYPESIAVITSPTGAAVQDMLNILKRRAPQLKVRVIPALVQGQGAADQIRGALELVNQKKLADLVVLARGGGSIEDLWCFNDEALARAIAQSKLPVVSAIGHEIDFTISDFVADVRAPTPSAAAEIVSGFYVEAVARVTEARHRARQAILRRLEFKRAQFQALSAKLVSPKDRLREQSQRCDDLMARLGVAIRARLDRKRAVLQERRALLGALSPLQVLERGYSITFSKSSGTVIRGIQDFDSSSAPEFQIRFKDGSREVHKSS